MTTKNKILKTKPKAMQKAIKEAPLLPGCYIYRNKKHTILYVGKAKVLRNRVKSYFSNYNRVEEKIRIMIDQAESVEFYLTDSEIEALILESNLIKKYKPKYNSMLVDDKSYVYVKFEKLKATKPDQKVVLPTIRVVRDKEKDKADYFGPYPDSRTVKRLLRRLRKIFPYCTSKHKVQIPRNKSSFIQTDETKPCFHYQIDLCPGVCVGQVTRKEYEDTMNKLKQFFKGEKNKIQKDFETKMKTAARNQDFEEAARYRNLLKDIKYVGSNLRIDKDIDEVLIMQEKKARKKQALSELISRLDFPKDKLKNRKGIRIECYDISNIQGKYAVGSMVVFIDGTPKPQLYRRFRIRMENEPNDFAMLQEVLTRRFNQYIKSQLKDESTSPQLQESIPKSLKQRMKNWKADESFSQKPDLLIIDGGKGQLSSTYKILESFNLADSIPIVGLAKREEEIFKIKEQFFDWNEATLSDAHGELTTDDIFSKIRLPKRSEPLYLVQRIRDEAHRFAITYHRKLRAKQITTP